MKHRRAFSVAAALALLAATACDKATPVAPEGTILTISANPTLVASVSGTSTITVIARKGNGTPVNPGTEIRFDTTLGSIDTVVPTDRSGVARATLRGDGRAGTAKVSASTGALTPATVDVVVGTKIGSVTLQVTPSTVPEDGGTLELLALVRDDQGQPVSGGNANFSSAIGRLGSRGNFVPVDASGRARDSLTVSDSDISTLGGDTFTVKVSVAGGGSALMVQEFTVSVRRPPRAAFTFTVDNTTRTATFEDQSSPKPTSWVWEFGDGQTSTAQNPVHTYSPGSNSFVVTLTVKNAVGENSISKQVVFTPSGP